MPKIRGIKDGEILTANFDGKSKKNFPDIAKTKVLILLSIVGNPQCTGKFLQAAIESSIGNFSKVTFLVADEIYWHNLKVDPSPDEKEIEKLKHQALVKGNEYLQKNIPLFMNYLENKIPEVSLELKKHINENHIRESVNIINTIAKNNNLNFEILCWKDWVSSREHDYLGKEEEIKYFYENNYKLKKALADSVDNFAKRNRSKENLNLIKMQSHDYLLDESPAVIWLAARMGYHFIAYAGEEIEVFKATKDFFITDPSYKGDDKHTKVSCDSPDNYANWLVINFRGSSRPDKEFQTNKMLTASSVESGPEFFKTSASAVESIPSHVPSFVQGITKGILSMSGDENIKIQLLIKVLNEYSSSIKNQIEQQPDSSVPAASSNH